MDQSHLKVSQSVSQSTSPEIRILSLILRVSDEFVRLFLCLICRSPEDEKKEVEQYKTDVRRRLVNGGYNIWGNVGNQYSSIEGKPRGRRTFKLPNPMYYVY